MKNIIIFIATVLFSSLIGSCKKSTDQMPNASFDQVYNDNSQQQSTPIASEWQTARWRQSTSIDEASSFLQGNIVLADNSFSARQSDIRIVFVRIRGREDYYYQSLPVSFQASTGIFPMRGELSNQVLQITVNADESSDLPEISEVSNLEYQLISVPVEIFTRLSIDWSDYSAVTKTLNP